MRGKLSLTRRDLVAGAAGLSLSAVTLARPAMAATKSSQNRGVRRDERRRRVLGTYLQVLRSCDRTHVQRSGRLRDRRRQVPHRHRRHRRPERSQAFGGRHPAPDAAGRNPLHHRPQRRYHRGGRCAGAGIEQRHEHPLFVLEAALHAAAREFDSGHDRLVPGGPDHLFLSDEEQRREVGQLRGAERIRSAEPARAGCRGGQEARSQGRLRGRNLRARHDGFLPRHVESGARQARA